MTQNSEPALLLVDDLRSVFGLTFDLATIEGYQLGWVLQNVSVHNTSVYLSILHVLFERLDDDQKLKLVTFVACKQQKPESLFVL